MNSILNDLNNRDESNKIDRICLLYSRNYQDSLKLELSKYFTQVYTIEDIKDDFNVILFFHDNENSLDRLKGLDENYTDMVIVVYNLTGIEINDELSGNNKVYDLKGNGDINFRESISEYEEWLDENMFSSRN